MSADSAYRPDIVNPSQAIFADIDGDHDLDVLTNSADRNIIIWYANTDGKGTFGPKQIAANRSEPSIVIPADIDGDGDVDVVSAGGRDSSLVTWHENVDGRGTFAAGKTVWEASWLSSRAVYQISTADLDGDNDLDLLLNFSSGLGWLPNSDGKGTFGEARFLNSSGASTAVAADVDGDGDLDVLASGGISVAVWYENLDGRGQFGPRRTIMTAANQTATDMAAGDIDGDGDVDVITCSSQQDSVRQLAWYQNLDGKGTFGPQLVLTTGQTVRSVRLADLDGDGDADVLTSTKNSQGSFSSWYENLNGQGSFSTQLALSEPASKAIWSISAGDVDGDDDVDLLLAGEMTVSWRASTTGNGEFGSEKMINSNDVATVIPLAAVDWDADGDLDVWGNLGWYENATGRSPAVPPKSAVGAITAFYGAVGPESLSDIDGDGDFDLVGIGTSYNVWWRENTDGKGTFGQERSLPGSANNVASLQTADLDSDGDRDVLCMTSDRVAVWWQNLDGKGTFGPRLQLISPMVSGDFSDLNVADIDGDGDLDLLHGYVSTNEVLWYENTDGKGSFGPARTIASNVDRPLSVLSADIDGDGDLDVVSASSDDARIAWYENTDGGGNFGQQRQIALIHAASTVMVSDLDADGDLDVVAAGDSLFAWFENLDGQGSFSSARVIQPAAEDQGRSLSGWVLGDFDSDGDVDIFAGYADQSYQNRHRSVVLFRNRRLEDINDDGKVDVHDVDTLAVNFWAGTAPASWDFNGDSKVDLADREHLATSVLGLSEGDLDRDLDVDSADLLDLLGNWTGALQPGAGQGTWASGDLDGDLDTDSGDLLALLGNWTGATEPPVQPPSPLQTASTLLPISTRQSQGPRSMLQRHPLVVDACFALTNDPASSIRRRINTISSAAGPQINGRNIHLHRHRPDDQSSGNNFQSPFPTTLSETVWLTSTARRSIRP